MAGLVYETEKLFQLNRSRVTKLKENSRWEVAVGYELSIFAAGICIIKKEEGKKPQPNPQLWDLALQNDSLYQLWEQRSLVYVC